MNHTDLVRTDESEQFAYENARQEAEFEIYETLKDLFGVQGENLAYYLDGPMPGPPTCWSVLHALRGEYQRRVQSRANAILEAAQED